MTMWNVIGIKEAAHSSDVKAVARISNDKLVTAGRDGAVKLWSKGDDGNLEEIQCIREHEGFINSVAYIPSTSEYPQGLIVSGGSDKLINLWDYKENRICGTLIGHTENVCKLTVFPESAKTFPLIFASTSWDGTARCWAEDSSCIELKTEGCGSCWSIAGLGRDSFVTGHADKSLRIWRGDKQVQVIPSAHSDVVRDLLAVNSNCFISVGNDGKLKVWDSVNLDVLQTVNNAHSAFIYGLTWNGKDLLASYGEEGIVKIWKWNETEKSVVEVKQLRVPMMSAWCACFTDESTLLVAGSTGSIYAFSSESRNEKLSEAFEAEMAAFDAAANARKSAEIGRNAQDESVLKWPGERVGKTVLVRRNENLIEAHQWDGAEWQNLGEVVDPQSVKAPDFNFKVELDDTGRSYSLPYSWGENPYSVAKNFLERNDLPISHLDEVANFIVKNAGTPPTEAEPVASVKRSKSVEPNDLIIEAYNAEGVMGKLKSFGMLEISEEEIAVALKSWPIEKLFPCLDWLRVQVLQGKCTETVKVVPFGSILEAGTKANAGKEAIAAVTMTLRLLCNICAKKCTACYDDNLIVKVVGRCSQVISEKTNATWIPLLIGILYNSRAQLEATKRMALLHGLLSHLNDAKLGEEETERIYWLVKGAGGKDAPLAAAIKKEIEGIPVLTHLNSLF